MIQLKIKYKTKVDWLNYKDFDYTSTSVSFDTNENGNYVAKISGQGTIQKDAICEVGKRYRVSVEITELNSGIIDVYLGGEFIVSTSIPGTFTSLINNATQNQKLYIKFPNYNTDGEIGTITIEEIGYTEIDLFGDEKILLNYNLKDLDEPESISGNYSRQFKVPGTPKNNLFFKNIFEINEDSNFNSGVKCLATIESDSSNVMDGIIKLDNIIKLDEMYNYIIIFYNNTANLFNSIGDATFKDLDFSDLTHTVSRNTIANSWSSFSAGTVDYVYPYIDYGRGYEKMAGIVGNGLDSTSYGLICGELYPAVRMKTVVDKIFDKFGYTYSSSLLSSTTFNKIIIPFGNKESNIADYSNIATVTWNSNYAQELTFQISSSSELVSSTGAFLTDTVYRNQRDGKIQTKATYSLSSGNAVISGYDFRLDATDDYGRFNADPNDFNANNIAGVLPGTYRTLNEDIKYKIEVTFQLRSPAVGYVQQLYAYKLNTSDITYYQANSSNGGITGTWKTSSEDELKLLYQTASITYGSWQTASATFDCKYGDMIGLKLVADAGTAKYVGGAIKLGSIKIYRYAHGAGNTIDGNDILNPKIKIKDFLKSVNNAFNLVYEPDSANPNNIIIESYDDYFDNFGKTRDWTYKLDKNKEITLELPSDYLKKEWDFSYSEADDYWNKLWNAERDQIGLGWGGRKIRNRNEFVDKTNEIKLMFKPSQLRTSWKDDGYTFTVYSGKKYPSAGNDKIENDTDIGLRMLYFEYIEPYNTTQTFRFEQLNYDRYPYAGHITGINQQGTGVQDDLNFFTTYSVNNVWQLMANYHNPYNITNHNLYNKYWRSYVEAINNKNARIMTAYFYLNANDLHDFRFADKIYIDQTLFRVLSIDDFDVEGKSLTKVKLMKLDYAKVTYDDYTQPSDEDISQIIVLPKPPFINPNSNILGNNNVGDTNNSDNPVLIVGNNNAAVSGVTIGNNNSNRGGVVIGNNNSNASVNGHIFGSSGVTIGTGVTATSIGDSNKTIRQSGVFIGGMRISNGRIYTANEIEIGGNIDVDGVFNPWRFKDYQLVLGGENGNDIYDVNIWEIDGGDIDLLSTT